VEKEITMAPQTYAETLKQDSLKRAEREEALTSYIRDALAAREAEARQATRQSRPRALGRLLGALRGRALVRI
jgi:hypothetical protein